MTLATKRTSLYRHYDKENKLLYVGVSLSAMHRLSQHIDHSRWAGRICKVDIEYFETRQEALVAERKAIIKEKPEFNICHRNAIEEETRTNDISRLWLENKVVGYRPLYSITEAAEALGLRGPGSVKRAIQDEKLGFVDFYGKKMITGWQLIDFLESLEQERKEVA